MASLRDLIKNTGNFLKDTVTISDEERKRGKAPTTLERGGNLISEKIPEISANARQSVSDYFKPTENVRVRDFLREVPGATYDVGKEIVQGTARSFDYGGRKLFSEPLGLTDPVSEQRDTKLADWLYGGQEKRADSLGERGEVEFGVDSDAPIAPYLGFGITAIEFIPGGQGKGKQFTVLENLSDDLIEQFAKEKSQDVIRKGLVDSIDDIADEVVTKLADDIARETTPEGVRTVAKNTEDQVRAVTKFADEAARASDEDEFIAKVYEGAEKRTVDGGMSFGKSKFTPGETEQLDSYLRTLGPSPEDSTRKMYREITGEAGGTTGLASEAKKYKSAEEFIAKIEASGKQFEDVNEERLADIFNQAKKTNVRPEVVGEAMQEGAGGAAGSFQVLEDIVNGKKTDPEKFEEIIDAYGETQLSQPLVEMGPGKVRSILEEAIGKHRSQATGEEYTLYRIPTGKKEGVTYWSEDKWIAEGHRFEPEDDVLSMTIKENDPRVLMNWRTNEDIASENSTEWIVNTGREGGEAISDADLKAIKPREPTDVAEDALKMDPETGKLAEDGNKEIDNSLTDRRQREVAAKMLDPKQFEAALEAQKRGEIPFPELQARAGELSDNIVEIAEMEPGTVVTPERLESWRQIVNGQKLEIDKLKQNMLADPENQALREQHTEARKYLNRALVNVEAVRSEYARGLSASRLEDDTFKFPNAAKNINKVRDKLEPDAQIVFDKAIDNLDMENPSDVMNLLVKFNDADFAEKVVEYYRASLLSAVTTDVINISGAYLFQLGDIPIKAGAGALDTAKSAVTGSEREVYATEALELIMRTTTSLKEATIEAGRALMDEFYGYGMRRSLEEAGRKVPAIKGKKGKIIRIPYRFLSAMDLFIRTLKTNAEKRALGYRQAKKEGKKGLDAFARAKELEINPTADIIEMAEAKADRVLMLEDLTGLMRTIEKAKNKHPWVQMVLPFYKTLVGLVRETYRLTPARMIGERLPGRVGKVFTDKWTTNPSTRMEEISRQIMGTAMGATMVSQIMEGKLRVTGPAPKDPGEKERFYEQGKIPYSVYLGGKWYQYERLQPFSTILAIASQVANAWELYKESGEINAAEVEKQANLLMSETTRFIIDQAPFTGLTNFLEMIEGGPYSQGVLESGPNYLAQVFSGFVPNILFSVTRSIDPTIYESTGLRNSLMARIPGLQDNLTPRRNSLGETLQRSQSGMRQFLSPFKVSEVERQPIYEELERIDHSISMPSERVYGVRLSPEEYDVYIRDSGPRIREILNQIIDSSGYQKANVEVKRNMIDRVVREVRDESRGVLFPHYNRMRTKAQRMIANGTPEPQARKQAQDMLGVSPEASQLYAESMLEQRIDTGRTPRTLGDMLNQQ